MYFLPTSIIFISLALFTFYQTLKKREEKREKKNFTNELLVGFLFLFSGILFPFMYNTHSNLAQSTLNFLWLTTSVILIAECIIWATILSKNAIKHKKNTDTVWDYDGFCAEFRANWEYDFKKDVERKFLHLLPVFVIFFFWTLGTILDFFGILVLWGLDIYSFAFWLIITVGLGFCVMFQFADLARLSKPYLLPVWAQKWYSKSMKPDELNTFISSAPLVLSFVPFVFAPFPIFAAVALITAGADAAASLVGKKYGKRKFRENSVKTIEGYVAGAGMTFMIVIIISGIYINWMAVNVVLILGMAIVASIIFFLVDAFLSKSVTDNILNPILTGVGMWVLILI
ncbi:MAG: hypothetical protein EU544_05445 [Promethearchaeota archaeon]|nr:MAG: hypothetical protein EU544_05445 [Candidatus Lokiarchaeota archaeon]